ncbi:MAG: hypothetical protein N4A37_10655 [Prolixibacteraceae bacterium]|nr:hypothetical protein [Prolixibacteraceae bacterium]
MKYTLLTILLVLFLSPLMKAQEITTEPDLGKDIKKWSDGKLTWDDFIKIENDKSVIGFDPNLAVSQLVYNYKFFFKPQRERGKLELIPQLYCFMSKDHSWVNPDYMTEITLRYNQLTFDIYELYRRKAYNAFSEQNSLNHNFEVLSSIIDSSIVETSKLDHESHNGEDVESIIEWENKISNELNNVDPQLEPQTGIPLSESALEFCLGLGSQVYSGSLGDYLYPGLTIQIGAGVIFNRSSFLFDFSYRSNSELRKDLITDETWEKKTEQSFNMLNLYYSYSLFERKRWKISPFAGPSFNRICEITDDKEVKKEDLKNIGCFAPVLGISLSYNLNPFKKYLFNFKNEVISMRETIIKANFFVTYTKFNQNLQGYTTNFVIYYCPTSKYLKRKRN